VIGGAVDTGPMSNIERLARPSPWVRWPLLIGAVAQVALAALVGWGAIDLVVRDHPDGWEWGFRMIATWALVLCGGLLFLAGATLRGPVGSRIAWSAAGGVIGLALGRWLVGNQADESQFGPGWIFLALGAVILICAGAALGADLVPRRRSRVIDQPTPTGTGQGP
jgi:hypothetical protein